MTPHWLQLAIPYFGIVLIGFIVWATYKLLKDFAKHSKNKTNSKNTKSNNTSNKSNS